MQVFTYPLFYKIILRFGNIPLTLLLIFYLVPSAVYIDKDPVLAIPLIISAFLIYFLNKQYMTLYKIIPYKIILEDKKLVCSEFIFSKREVEINLEDIEQLKGGIFDGKLRGIQKIFDGKNKIYIGYFSKLKNSQLLGTVILSKVSRAVYDEVIKNVTKRTSRKK
jgi:hypothetical protein